MNNLSNRYKGNSKKKAQLFLFYILLIVVLIVAAVITTGIGNVAKTKSYTSNSADSGVLAGASTLATAFNYLARANMFFEDNYLKFQDEAEEHFDNAEDYLDSAQSGTQTAYNIACSDPCDARDMISGIICDLEIFVGEMEMLGDTSGTVDYGSATFPYGIIPNYQAFQEEFYQKVRDILHKDEDFQFDFYNVALAATYKFNMLNSGIMVKLPPEGKEQFIRFTDEIAPGHVANGVPLEFAWGEDGEHRVVVESLIDPIRNHKLRVAEDDLPVILENLDKAIEKAEKAIEELEEAEELLDDACGCYECDQDCEDDCDCEGCLEDCNNWCYEGIPDCGESSCEECCGWVCEGQCADDCVPCSDCCDVGDYCDDARIQLSKALDSEDEAEEASTEAWEGIQIECDEYITYRTEDAYRINNKIIGWIYDIIPAEMGEGTHLREVFSSNHQFHNYQTDEDGLLALDALEDISISSSAVATWNYEDRGWICSQDCDTCAPFSEHDSAILRK